MTFESAEVVETHKAFKSNQVDDKGKKLPLGSVKVRIHNKKQIGNIGMFYARPFGSVRTFPLLGEHVMVFKGPIYETTDSLNTVEGWYYMPQPLNINNDATYNVMQHHFHRAKEDEFKPFVPKKPGKTFPFPVRPSEHRQFFEGDTIIQNRSHASIRLGSTIKGDLSIYDEKPTWKDGANGDPIIIFSIKDPLPNPKKLPPEYTRDKPEDREIKDTLKYSVEDASKDLTSIYITSNQRLPKIKPARSCPRATRSIPRFSNPQAVFDTERIVLNARKNDLFALAKETVYLSGKKIQLTTNKHDVDFDELVDIVHDLAKELRKLTTAQATFATIAGPTGPATNAGKLIQLFFRVKRLKSICVDFNINLPQLPSNYKLGTDGVEKNSESSTFTPSPGSGNAPSQNSNSPTSNPSSDGPLGPSLPGNSDGNSSDNGGSGTSSDNSSNGSGNDGSSGDGSGGSGGDNNSTGNGPDNDTPTDGSFGGGTPTSGSSGSFDSSGSLDTGSINPEYDDISIDIPVGDVTGSGGTINCTGQLYELKGTITSVQRDNVFEDSVYLVKVESDVCEDGWYAVGSKKIDKVVADALTTLPQQSLKGYVSKLTLEGDCLSKLVYIPIYKKCFYFIDYELIDLDTSITINRN
jgi:hypothetical protein